MAVLSIVGSLEAGAQASEVFGMRWLQLVVWSRAIVGAAAGLAFTLAYTILLFATIINLTPVIGSIVAMGLHLLLAGLMRVAAGAVTALLVRQRYEVSGRSQFLPTAIAAGVLGWLVLVAYMLVAVRYVPAAEAGMTYAYLSVFEWVAEFCLGAILISPKEKVVDPAAALHRGRYAEAFQYRDGGAAVVEFVGVVIVVATMVLGTIATVAPSTVGTTFMQAICKAYSTVSGQPIDCGTAEGQPGDGQTGEGSTNQEPPAKTDADYKPDSCKTSEDSQKASVSVTILFIKFGEDSGFTIQKFNMNDDDPSNDVVRVAVTDGASLGAEVGAGGEAGKGKKVGADVNIGGGLRFGYGDTWEFSGVDSEGRNAWEQWENMKADLNAYIAQRTALMHDTDGGYAMSLSMCEWLGSCQGWLDPPKDPTYAVTEFDFHANASGNLGLNLPTGQPTAAGSGDTQQGTVKLGLGLTATGTDKITQKTNRETGEKSLTWSLSGSVAGNADYLGLGADRSGSIDGAFTVTSDKDGNVTSLTFATTTEVGFGGHLGGSVGDSSSGKVSGKESGSTSTSTVVTTTLDMTQLSAEEKATVGAWLGKRMVSNPYIPPGVTLPTSPSADPFENLMYNKAKVSQLVYDNIKDKVQFGASVKAGWKFGFDFSTENKVATLSDAQYLGRPEGDKSRVMIPHVECAP